METSLYQGKFVTIVEFQRRRTSPLERTTCPACKEELFVHSLNSVVKAASFNHRKRKPGEPECVLSNMRHPDYWWLTPVAPAVVSARAQALKRQFYTKENLARAFQFLVKMAGKGAISREIFALLLRKAEKVGLWEQSGLPVWAVPYLLLTLMDLLSIPYEGKVKRIRFIVLKPTKSHLRTIWLNPQQCSLERRVMLARRSYLEAPYAKKSERPIENPLHFSEANFLAISADHKWAYSNVANLHEEVAQEPVEESLDTVVDKLALPKGSTPVAPSQSCPTTVAAVSTIAVSDARTKPSVQTSLSKGVAAGQVPLQTLPEPSFTAPPNGADEDLEVRKPGETTSGVQGPRQLNVRKPEVNAASAVSRAVEDLPERHPAKEAKGSSEVQKAASTARNAPKSFSQKISAAIRRVFRL